jgi:hypothetical protein
MTVINNIEIDDYNKNPNIIKQAILHNEPIEDKLNVVIVVSNPCLYAKRYILAREFINRIETEETHVNLYIVELCYNDQKFIITDKKNKRHLQLRTNTPPLWHKENMINIGIKKLLPKNWKAVAWIDADVEFENTNWALDTLKILNGCKDIVQIFSHCVDMDQNELAIQVPCSFGYNIAKENSYINKGVNFWHPGFAWACTRKAYDKMEGLYDLSILGSGDHNMALSLIKNGHKSLNELCSDNYKESIQYFQDRVKNIRCGYTPGVIRHHFHGTKANRKYSERWQILVKHQYDPYAHVKYNDDGLLVPTADCPQELLDDIMNYFKERNEDEFCKTVT